MPFTGDLLFRGDQYGVYWSDAKVVRDDLGQLAVRKPDGTLGAILANNISVGTIANPLIADIDADGFNLLFAGKVSFGTASTEHFRFNRASATRLDLEAVTVGDLASLRIVKGDVLIDDAGRGFILKDSGGTYWRFSMNTFGALATTNLGTTLPI